MAATARAVAHLNLRAVPAPYTDSSPIGSLAEKESCKLNWQQRRPPFRKLRRLVLVSHRVARCDACERAKVSGDSPPRLEDFQISNSRPKFVKEGDGWQKGSQINLVRDCVSPLRRRTALLGAVSAAALWKAAESADAATSLADASLEELKLEIKKAVTLAKAPGVLRLAFHDGFTYNPSNKTGGPNGSVIFELDRPENEGLKRAIRPLEKVKASLGGRVSWADLIAVAAAEAVAMTGGPVIPVRLGRLDQGVADPEDQMPPETLDAAALKSFFHSRNYSTQEMIALCGAHTLGGKGFGDPTTFDNSYYKILLEKPWETGTAMTQMIGLKTDRALPDDEECRMWVVAYAEDQGRFFRDFAAAYDKMVSQGATWKPGYA